MGLLTENQPKFDRGNQEIREILRLASEIISRAFEDMPSCLPNLHNRELVERFVELDSKLHFMKMLRKVNAAQDEISDMRNFILIVRAGEDGDEELEILPFPNATVALRRLFSLERDEPGSDLVLVKGDRPEDVREAFKNYFSDARDFIKMIENGCSKLVQDKISVTPHQDQVLPPFIT